MKKFFRYFVSCCFFVCICSFLFSAHPLTTDDAKTVDQSGYELELSYDYSKVTDSQEQSFGLSFKHGLTEKMDIGVSFPYLFEPKESFGQASIGLKFSVVKDLLTFSITNPLGSSEYFLNSIFSYEISPVILHLNLGYQSTGQQDVEGSITYSSAFEWSIKKFDIVGEILGDKDGFQDYLLGFRYNFIDGVAFSFAYGNGFNEKREKITSGFHYEFK